MRLVRLTSSAHEQSFQIVELAGMLEQVDNGIWFAEGKCVNFYGLPYPTRCVIVRLSNDDLWIWSPTALTRDLHQRLHALGLVRHLVSPNKLHHLYLRDWKIAYPEALLWGPQSTIQKRPDLVFRGLLGDQPPAEWLPDIDQAWFRGSFAMDEILFYHRPSATAIVADLIQTFSDHFLREHWGFWRCLARLDGITQDQALAPLEWRLSFINRAPARAARDKVLGWGCQRIIMAHGELVRANGSAQLDASFKWLGST